MTEGGTGREREEMGTFEALRCCSARSLSGTVTGM